MTDIDAFTDSQKQFLSRIVDDLSGPTVAVDLLRIIENLLYSLAPDWEESFISDIADAKADIDVCIAALTYQKVRCIATA